MLQTGDYLCNLQTVRDPIKVNDNGISPDACLLVGGLFNNFDEASNTISLSFDILYNEMPVNEYANDVDSSC
jgi:hypothetical protein